ncbi:YybH family protein [Streptomyces sp. NPDC048370]|uniref:YybH family protein n=1 Tax=unclassified Streptomyces TaxID=2593676 RepID=UPI0033CD8285
MANIELTDDATKHTDLYVRAINSGDAAAVNAMYTPEAVAAWEKGKPLTGREREEYVEEFLKLKPVMTATTRHAYVTADTALLVVDWTMEIVHPDGTKENGEGVGLDVLRRGEDGKWRYAIDDPYGESK